GHQTVRQLKVRYCQLFGEPSRSHHKQFLVRRIAWRLQALAQGDLSERARQRALTLAQDADLRLRAPQALPQPSPPSATAMPQRPPPLPPPRPLSPPPLPGPDAPRRSIAQRLPLSGSCVCLAERHCAPGQRCPVERIFLLRLAEPSRGYACP